MIKIVDVLSGIVKDNEKMIYKLARSISINNIEDLYQVGVIGLINAYNNYDESYNVKFSTYAYTYILGEMKKYIRENNGIKISRDITYLSKRLDKLIELLSQKYKRTPTTYELSIETDIPEWKIIEALNIRSCIKSMDDPITENLTIEDTIKSNDEITEYAIMNEMMEVLNEEEVKIIKDRYFYDKSQTELAKETGYSQAKVSREEKKILQKLRNYYRAS